MSVSTLFIFQAYHLSHFFPSLADHGVYKEEISLTENEMHMVSVLSAPVTGQYIASQTEQVSPFLSRRELWDLWEAICLEVMGSSKIKKGGIGAVYGKCMHIQNKENYKKIIGILMTDCSYLLLLCSPIEGCLHCIRVHSLSMISSPFILNKSFSTFLGPGLLPFSLSCQLGLRWRGRDSPQQRKRKTFSSLR